MTYEVGQYIKIKRINKFNIRFNSGSGPASGIFEILRLSTELDFDNNYITWLEIELPIYKEKPLGIMPTYIVAEHYDIEILDIDETQFKLLRGENNE